MSFSNPHVEVFATGDEINVKIENQDTCSSRRARFFRLWMAIPLLMLVLAGQGLSPEREDFKGLRGQLAVQEELLLKQGEFLKTRLDDQKRLMEQIENLKKRLSELEQSKFAPTPSPAPPAAGNQAP